MIPAIPTIYSGVRFRSRLEARWAAYFDLRGDTTWQYEPLEFPGWIPDFTINVETSRGTADFIVEVKPISDVRQFTDSKDGSKTLKALVKDIQSNSSYWSRFNGLMILGESPASIWFWPAKQGFHRCALPDENLISCWKEAGNRTQWKAPRA